MHDAHDASGAHAAVHGNAPLSELVAATTSAVRTSWKQSSGWAWMSRRTAAMPAACVRMESMSFMDDLCVPYLRWRNDQRAHGIQHTATGRGHAGDSPMADTGRTRSGACHSLRRITLARAASSL